MTRLNKLTALAAAVALSGGLAACGGGGGSTDTSMMPTPQEMCEDAGGRYNADGSCTSATELQVETLQAEIAALRMQLGLEPSDDIGASIADLQMELTNLRQQVQDAKDAEDKAAEEAAAATAAALHDALGSNPLGNLDRATNAGGAVLADAGDLTIDQVQGSLAADPAAVMLEAGDAAAPLGSWNGTHYAHTDADAEVENSAIVWTNQAAPGSDAFADQHTLNADGAFVVATGGTIDTAANIALVMAAGFTHSGTQSHSPADRADAVYFRGTYHGAPGEYRCAGTDCSSTNDGSGSPSELGGTWTFTPDMGAMVADPDTAYLYFGWWLRKDEGDPTSASAFFGEVGDVEGGGTLTDPSTIAGSATYSGHAAGKFAIDNPLGGSDSGHFTADATLTAKFGGNAAPNNGGVSGTLDNFMANEQDVPWSVTLNRAWWGTGGAFGGVDQDPDTTGDQLASTVWSIDGNEADASGNWNGQMYDEALAPTTADDGSNIPTSAAGVFQSMFGSTHTMVGAFGVTAD